MPRGRAVGADLRIARLQYGIWDDATATPAKLTEVDAAPKPKGRRSRRPPLPPGPNSTIIVHPHMDTAERPRWMH